ncbi:MAG: thioether cross-link-forming SCIFF peptide maturase [Desulfitobacteriaceae bacterium]
MLNLDGYLLKKNVHVFRQGDLNIVYDVNSGSLHILDALAYGVLKALEVIKEQDDTFSIETIHQVLTGPQGGMVKELKPIAKGASGTERSEAGMILSKDELQDILSELGELQGQGSLFSAEAEETEPSYPSKPIVKAICLHVAHDCNLRCEYCFAGAGAFGGNRTLMDLEIGKKGIDFVLQASGHRSQCEVDFFGGEPLLNFRVVKELVRYGRGAAAKQGKTIKFTLTTNVVLLTDEVQVFLEEEDISVVLSLDGRREVHDRMRPFVHGHGSYDKVVPAIQKFVAKRPESSPYAVGTYYYVRGTYTHFNLDFDKDVVHMFDLGIQQISLEPVVAAPGDAYAFQAGDLKVISESYDRLGEEIIKRQLEGQPFNFFHFNMALDQGPCLPKRLSGCGAGHEYVAISPEGDLYPCHQFVGQEEYKLGSLYAEDPLPLDSGLVQTFRSAHIYNKPSCRECWARFSCSGGCHAANSASTGKLTEVYELGCQLQRKRLEVALYVKAKELQAGGQANAGAVPSGVHC